MCAKCGKRFLREGTTDLYCEKHRGYEKIENKTIFCVDCGKVVEVDAWNMKTIRCNNCQKTHDKLVTRIRVQKYRLNSSNN